MIEFLANLNKINSAIHAEDQEVVVALGNGESYQI
jgi:hypothetical protein